MSKHSTKTLVEGLETIVTEANASEQFRFSKLNRSIADVIIARLRAGDVGTKFIEHIQAHLKPGQEVICKICGKSAKAIAEYGGKP